MTSAQEYATMMRAMTLNLHPEIAAKVNNAHCIIAEHGRSFTPRKLPKDYPLGMPQQCFKNAAHLVLNDPEESLVYVEGYSTKWIPIHHAWAVTKTGKVIDNTWLQGPGDDYFGVPIAKSFLREWLRDVGVYGVFFNYKGADKIQDTPIEHMVCRDINVKK